MSTKRKTPDAPRNIKAGDPVRRAPREETTETVPEFAALDAAAEGRVEYRKVRVRRTATRRCARPGRRS